MIEIIPAVENAIAIVKRLREVSKNVSEAEFRNLLADLSNELADAKMQIASLKEQLALLADENRTLKAAQDPDREKPRVRAGCYEFQGDPNLYCTACYDTKGQKHLVAQIGSFKQCPVCKAVLG